MAQAIALEQQQLPEDCLVFKHSTQCPVSKHAANAVRAADLPLPLYWVNVIEQRPLSTWIAEHFGVIHESPQLLLIRGGKVQQSWSHFAIEKVLEEGGIRV